MKSKVLSSFFDLTDINTIKCLAKLTESEEAKISAKITSDEIENVSNIANSDRFDQKIKSSKIYKELDTDKGRSKIRKILEDTVNKIRNVEIIHLKGNKNERDEAKRKVARWSDVMITAIGVAFICSNKFLLVILSFLITIEIGKFIATFISMAIVSSSTSVFKTFIHAERINETLDRSLTYRSIESLSKIDKNNMKYINSSINNGKLNLVENFEQNNILNELLFLPARIINTLLEFIINVVRYPVYLFYSTRVSIDDYLQLQIQFLESNIKNGKLDKEVKEKQQKWLDNFKALSCKISVDFNKANVEAENKLSSTKKPKKKISDVTNEIPSNVFLDF